jgi:sortase A
MSDGEYGRHSRPEDPYADAGGAPPVMTATTPPPQPAAPHRRIYGISEVVRTVLRGIGQTLVTLGLVVLLFVVYEVWITNIFAHQAQHKVHTALENAWSDGVDPLPGSGTSGIPLGTGIANLYIPRLGRDYAFTIVEGSGDASLEKGPGHYVGSALPGQPGDFAVAGHRVGKGEPFLNIDHLKPGDTLIVETLKDWFVYTVLGDVPTANLAVRDVNGVPGREIVDPSQNQVILPIPNKPGAKPDPSNPADYYMTMTTCHPKFTAAQRMIVHAKLTATLPKAKIGAKGYVTKMPDSILALYTAAGV